MSTADETGVEFTFNGVTCKLYNPLAKYKHLVSLAKLLNLTTQTDPVIVAGLVTLTCPEDTILLTPGMVLTIAETKTYH